MDRKTDVLEQTLPLSRTRETSHTKAPNYRSGIRHTCLLFFINAIGLFTLIYLVLDYWPRGAITPPSKATRPVITYPDHDKMNLNYTRRELLQFDVDAPAYSPIGTSISIAEWLDMCDFSWDTGGTVRLVRGDPEQKSNFVFGIEVSASSQMALDSVIWQMHEDLRGVFIRCVNYPTVTVDKHIWDASVRVDVTVFIKPHTLQFEAFTVNVDVLDIEIAEDLAFETYHMSLSTRNGSIVGSETWEFTAHEISIASVVGGITGNWSLPSSIELRTGGYNALGGPIDVDLIPKRWSAGPNTQGVLIASSEGGNISIRTPIAERTLSLRNMSIDVHSQSGSIDGTFVTGIRTSLTTKSGSINAILLPDFALPDTSTIITATESGNTDIRVLSPIIDSYYLIDPLINTKSEHSVTNGSLKLRYPWEWRGTALGISEKGNVSIAGSLFTTIIRDDYLVVGRTGKDIASRLDFSTTSGYGELIVE